MTPFEQISSYAFIITSCVFAYRGWKKTYYARLRASTSDPVKQFEYEALGGLTDIEAKRAKFLIPRLRLQTLGFAAAPVFYLCWRFFGNHQGSGKRK